MAITDTTAIQFSNTHLRTSADKLLRSFYLCQKFATDWNSISGTDDEKLTILRADIVRLGVRVSAWYSDIFIAKRLYDSLSMHSLFPNDANEILVDGSLVDGRSAISGQDVRRLNSRMKEWLAWLSKGVFDDLSVNTMNWNFLEMFLKATTSSLVAADAIAIRNRCTELVTQWAVTNPAYLAHVSKLAVNGNGAPS